MPERLSSADVAFLYLETPRIPQHVGTIAVFEVEGGPGAAAAGLSYERLVALLEERIALVARYRQKMRRVPANLANPVWVDDPRFDITYHVRRSALPRPGDEGALLDFCARVQARLLDRDRPLWELYLVEGVAGGRVAIVTKAHHSMVNGVSAVHIAQVLLDDSPSPRRIVAPVWMPHGGPNGRDLAVEAIRGLVMRRPHALADAVRLGLADARSMTRQAWRLSGGLFVDAARSSVAPVRRAPPAPLRAEPGRQRRIALARTRLADYREVAHATGASVHDVALACVTGALRGWLTGRGEQLAPNRTVRALVPVSVLDGGPADSRTANLAGTRVRPVLVDLPVGAADPLRRLTRLRYAMVHHTTAPEAVRADALVGLAGFAAPTVHALGARAASGLTRRLSDVVVANVPGAQQPRFAAGARMLETFPVLPLGQGQALAIGLTSYAGAVYYGINADRDAVADAHLLGRLLEQALDELSVAARSGAGADSAGHRSASVRRARGGPTGRGRG